MSHYPGATWRPIAHNVGGAISPRAVVWHTAVDGASTTSLFGWFNSPARKGTSAHGFIAGDGSMEQYIEFNRLAGHAFVANHFALGIETHDGGHPEIPWTPGQVARMVDFMRWCRDALGIPIQLIDSSTGSGHGYHCQFKAWNKSAHTCPGPVRIKQLASIVATAAAKPAPTPTPWPQPTNTKDDDMFLLMNNPHTPGQVWFTDGMTKRGIANPTSLAGMQLLGASVGHDTTVHDVKPEFFDDLPLQNGEAL